MGATKAKWAANQLQYYDGATFETILPISPFFWQDDFVSALDARWTAKDSGAATEALVADQSCGVAAMTLTNANEKQYAGLMFNDELVLNLDKGPVIEIRAAVSVTPTDQAELYLGVINNWGEGPYAEADAGATVHALFLFDAALLCKIHTDDASTDNDAVTTGVTVTGGTFYVFKIDFTDITSVKFYINGARVASGTTFDMSNGSNVMVQPLVEAHKEAGAGVGTLQVDYVRIWQPTR